MTYRVDTAKSAEKDFEKLDAETQKAFLKASFSQLLQDPFHLPQNLDVKKLQDFASTFRVRMGKYRMVYVVNKKAKVVTVVGYDSRGDAYKDEDALRDKEKKLLKAAGAETPFEFAEECLGAHHGQTDMRMTASYQGKKYAHVDYALYDGIVHVDYVKAEPGHGAGFAVMKELIRKYGWDKIKPGMTTPEGTHLVEKLDKEFGPHYTGQNEHTQEELKEFAAQMSGNVESLDPGPTADELELYVSFGDEEAAHDFVSELQDAYKLPRVPSVQYGPGKTYVLALIPRYKSASVVTAPMDTRIQNQHQAWLGMREVGAPVDALRSQVHSWALDAERHPWLWVYDGGNADTVIKAFQDALAAVEAGDLAKADAAVEKAFAFTSSERTASYDVQGDIFGPSTWQRPLPSELAPKEHEPQALVRSITDRYPVLNTYLSGVKVVMEPHDKGPEARTKGSTVHLFPKYWHLSMETQDWAFAHEVGHVLFGRVRTMDFIDKARDMGVDVWDTDELPYGQPNMEEAFADCFASFVVDPTELRQRYPKWMEIVKAFV